MNDRPKLVCRLKMFRKMCLFSIVFVLHLASSAVYSFTPKLSFLGINNLKGTKSSNYLSAVVQDSRRSSDDEFFWQEFLDRFQGDFDNYDQVVEDRQNGLTPREGGGHENIHCTLLPLPPPLSEDNENEESNSSNNSTNIMGRVVAAFYFNGMPQQIFRLRLYTLYQIDDGVQMVLNTFQLDVERVLKETPMHQWSDTIQQQLLQKQSWDKLLVNLPECDIIWTEQPDPKQHAYAYNNNPYDAYHAVMLAGPNGTTVASQVIPGMYINIRDELSLWKNEFWINDRGLDPQNVSSFIYGNQRGIPYKLKRVTQNNNIFRQWKPRMIHDPKLAWTLGPDHRTEFDYQQMMNEIEMNSTSM